MDKVRLPDLEVIRRFSIAVRREHAPAEEVVAALRADLEMILRAQDPAKAAARKVAPATKGPAAAVVRPRATGGAAGGLTSPAKAKPAAGGTARPKRS